MAEYIDRNLLLMGVDGNISNMKTKYGGIRIADYAINLVQLTRDYIAAIPAADVAPVVRCKDCKHWNKDALACDTLPWVDSSEHANWYAEDFCSYGERKDGDG